MDPKGYVLVVEDDLDARAILELALCQAGYIVTLASNGAEALAAARRQRPDVILLDLAMPVMDGFAFRAAQLCDPELATVPVICVSGRHDASEVARTMQLSGCVSKPFLLDELISRVGELT
jgi:CheY-like chemotaxis protein